MARSGRSGLIPPWAMCRPKPCAAIGGCGSRLGLRSNLPLLYGRSRPPATPLPVAVPAHDVRAQPGCPHLGEPTCAAKRTAPPPPPAGPATSPTRGSRYITHRQVPLHHPPAGPAPPSPHRHLTSPHIRHTTTHRPQLPVPTTPPSTGLTLSLATGRNPQDPPFPATRSSPVPASHRHAVIPGSRFPPPRGHPRFPLPTATRSSPVPASHRHAAISGSRSHRAAACLSRSLARCR
jgi:hypothetical protein